MFPVRSAIAVTAALGVLLLPHTSGAEPQQSSASSWASFRSPVSQQSLQTVLVSIEERLRGLDTLFSPRYTPRWEVSIEQQTRRLEAVESRLGRLETLIELRLDKMAETLSARQLKEELSRDQMSRKVDSVYERLNHRIGYMEARLDMGITKLQTNVEAGTGKLERLETTNSGRQSEIEAELVEMGSGIDEIKQQLGNFEEQHNKSLNSITSNTRQLRVEVEDLMTIIEQLQVAVNKTRAEVPAGETIGHNMKKDSITSEKLIEVIDKHANNFISKTNNMYNELWRKMQILEGLVKDSMSLSNATRRELQEGIRSIAIQLGRRGLLQADRERQDGIADRPFEMAVETLSHLQRKLTDLGRKFDSSFQMLMLAQNLFLESCHRIQMDEPQLETKLSKVLEKILETISNRSSTTEREMQVLQEILKSHTSQLMRTIGHATSTLVQVSEQSTDDNKHLEATILTLKDRLNENSRYVEQTVSSIQEERNVASEKLDSIIASIQELHDYVTELPANFGIVKPDEDRDETSSCPDAELLASELVRELQQRGLVNNMQNKLILNNMTTFVKSFISEMKSNGIVDVHFQEDDSVLVIDHNIMKDFADDVEESLLDSERTINNGTKDLHNTANQSVSTKLSQVPQLHRFDIHASKRLSNITNEGAFTPAHVAIEVFPYTRSSSTLQDTYDLSENEMDLTNVAAIIHNTHPNSNAAAMTLVQSLLSQDEKERNASSATLHNSQFPSNPTNATEVKSINHTATYNSATLQDLGKDAPEASNMGNSENENWSESMPNENFSLIFNTAELNTSENKTSEHTLPFNNTAKLSSPHTNSESISNLTNADEQLLTRNPHNFWSGLLGEIHYDSSEDIISSTSTEDRLQNADNIASLRTIQNLTSLLSQTKNMTYDHHAQQYLNKLRDLAANLVSRSEIQRSSTRNVSIT